MCDAAVDRVFTALRDAAATDAATAYSVDGPPARFVGGCVRDALLGRSPGDIDIATRLTPDRVAKALKQAGLRTIPTGLDHGTLTALVPEGTGQRTFEITTLRLDVETDGRHAVVAFTTDWQADAARRDFTMNALSADPDGRVHDYFGGVADALTGRVRFVGDPARRLTEDVLRLLRFFRFQAHYGRTAPEEAALQVCSVHAPELAHLAGERIRVELFRLLAAPDPAPVWRLMQRWAIAPHVLVGRTGDAGRLAALVQLESEPDPIRRLAALWDGNPEETLALAERLRLSAADRDRLVRLAARRGQLSGALEPAALRRLLYEQGPARGQDLLLLAWAEAPEDNRFATLLAAAETWALPRFPLQGRDALAVGVPPGPQVGQLLRTVDAWWLAGDFSADRNACLAELIRLVANPASPTSAKARVIPAPK